MCDILLSYNSSVKEDISKSSLKTIIPSSSKKSPISGVPQKIGIVPVAKQSVNFSQKID